MPQELEGRVICSRQIDLAHRDDVHQIEGELVESPRLCFT